MGKPKIQTSLEIRQLIVKKHQDGWGYKRISREFAIPRSTIKSVIDRFKERGTVENEKRLGPARKTSSLVDRKIVRAVKKTPFTTTK